MPYGALFAEISFKRRTLPLYTYTHLHTYTRSSTATLQMIIKCPDYHVYLVCVYPISIRTSLGYRRRIGADP